jgi:hypothetical protein
LIAVPRTLLFCHKGMNGGSPTATLQRKVAHIQQLCKRYTHSLDAVFTLYEKSASRFGNKDYYAEFVHYGGFNYYDRTHNNPKERFTEVEELYTYVQAVRLIATALKQDPHFTSVDVMSSAAYCTDGGLHCYRIGFNNNTCVDRVDAVRGRTVGDECADTVSAPPS